MGKARRTKGLISKRDVAKLAHYSVNIRHLFEETVADLQRAGERLDQVTRDDGEELLERVAKVALAIAEDEARKEDGTLVVSPSTRLSALSFIAGLRHDLRSLEAKQRSEAAKMAVDMAKTQNQLFLEERKLQAQERMAGGAMNGDDYSVDDLERLASRA